MIYTTLKWLTLSTVLKSMQTHSQVHGSQITKGGFRTNLTDTQTDNLIRADTIAGTTREKRTKSFTSGAEKSEVLGISRHQLYFPKKLLSLHRGSVWLLGAAVLESKTSIPLKFYKIKTEGTA